MTPRLTPGDILRFDRMVPRYTSYPTAADFTDAVDDRRYRQWLAAIPEGEDISLYVHIPFCHSLCWFCGCHTTVARRPEPVERYLDLVIAEIDMLVAALGAKRRVSHIHWGGGTPTILGAGGITRLAERLRAAFTLTSGMQFAVEIDPRTVTRDAIAALAAAGVTRASLGVQDFDPVVQRLINRIQSFETTARVVEGLRAVAIEALNIDLLYGLPAQTEAGLLATVEATLALAPQRIALFGYAHVPWMKRHQKLIDTDRLPDAAARQGLFNAAMARFLEAGYVAIGIDHLALPTDPLAKAARDGSLRRNFQGYTSEPASVLLGLGTSAIGAFAQGYVQNAARTADYRAAIEAGRFATARGIETTAEDRLRGRIIEQLMCHLEVDLEAMGGLGDDGPRGDGLEGFADVLAELAPLEACGAVHRQGGRIKVLPEARLLLRVVCAAFDRRLPAADQTTPRHAAAV
ncbi:MAG: oxygen-independent coproporphyrinogen III oxidase [Proteobacteria bacterium]|nr:oxygen-independent coproporphyrinogen III oxidase [Pseudomonadota bacterium]